MLPFDEIGGRQLLPTVKRSLLWQTVVDRWSELRLASLAYLGRCMDTPIER